MFEHSLKNAYIGEPRTEYTLTDVPTWDVNKYISIAKSWHTVEKVEFSYTSTLQSTNDNDWVRISWTNNTANRYWIWFTHVNNTPQIQVNWNINSASPTMFQTFSPQNWTHNVKFTIESWTTKLEVTWANTISQTWTQTTAEKNIVDTVLNSSTINAYASRDNGATLSDIVIKVWYS